MAFISSSNTSSGKGEVPTASVPTTSSQVSTVNTEVVAASLSHDTICAYIVTQSSGSQIKYKDITQIDKDNIEEMDIKWNLALLSMKADRFWKKTGKKITIQGSDVARFDKSKVECFNCHKMGYFPRECRAPRSQDRGKRESYRKDPKVEEPAPKVLMAIDGIGWDWSYMANEDENHALVADDVVPTEFALMAMSSSSLSSDNEVYNDSYCSKSCRKNTENLNTKINKLNEELSDCETDLIRVMERDVDIRDNKTESLKNELEELKKEKESIDHKLAGFGNASKDLNDILESQKSAKDKTGVGFNEYNAVPSPPAQVYSPPKKDLSWTCLPEFMDDTVTDYTRPTPSVDVSKDVRSDLDGNNTFIFEIWVAKGETWPRGNYSQNNVKSPSTHKSMTPRAVLLKSGSKPIVVNKPKMNVAQPTMPSFKTTHSNVKRPFGKKTAAKNQIWIPKVPTGRTKIPTVGSNVPTAKPTCAADLGNKGKAVKALARWIWKPKENTSGQGLNFNDVLVTFKKYQYIDTQGRLKSVMAWIHGTQANILPFENEPLMEDLLSLDMEVDRLLVKRTIKTCVLFTDSECLVLGKDFKASMDESMMWHRRLGHLNFKTMNKLVRNNLVRGLPSKSFENDHTCVACLKGKQHKASCKTKLVNFVSKPLHTLHMDLFGPTSVSSLNHKWLGLIAKGDEGYFVGYSLSSKAFRVFNKRTKKVEENLHVDFLENKPIEKGAGPNWLFDIDSLTNSMNYVPVVVAGTSSTNISGTKEDANQAVKDNVSSLRFIALPNWFHDAHMETSNDSVRNSEANDDPQKEQDGTADVSESSGNTNPTASSKDSLADQVEPVLSPTVESEVPTISSPVPTVSTNALDSELPELPASPTVETVVPTISTPIQMYCLFSCFLSQEEPKKIVDALKDESWVEAMQEELLQFQIQNVWVLVDCPKGARPIGTKWVLKNKKYERGIVIRNKARLVAQGYTQEEGIDYEEFCSVAELRAN
ncbi:ribonuclease H-like domain-containing protein [Tanacetum coccineum]